MLISDGFLILKIKNQYLQPQKLKILKKIKKNQNHCHYPDQGSNELSYSSRAEPAFCISLS